ncbi:ABC transporter substrate-binding protein [Paralimibaculum aggregatum]|uniref:ABC transporter substrate-binding protein n=1 Tax=Paralimibaculum aggregatum TaxID=3036245 RepID=A0ABQ6LQT5_9RHOB|nr:ABC transporter substrate-binding protein [Limibaculum sp. NKW23]GMG83095.1 ABC transporter substrate-binding protein [Limibaculum sp. NKW23]
MSAFHTTTRRGFIEGAGALALGAAFAAPARATGPKPGGRLRVAIAEGSTSDTLDPQGYADNYMIAVGFATHSTLTEIAPSGELVGDAAESWESTPDAATWTFRLRRDVTFSDGRRLTAADVAASIDHHRGEGSTSAARDVVAGIARIEAPEDGILRFVLDGPNADFPYLMADYHLLLMPAEGGRANWRDYVGTGGYVLESFEPGVRTVLRRRDDHWKAGRAHFDEVEILFVGDAAARAAALATGKVDLMNRVDLKTADLLGRRPGLRIEESTGFLHYTTPMRTDMVPFDNNDLRLAIKHAVDREALMARVLRGHGTLGNDHPIAPSVPFHADLPQRVQDLDRARHHLKKAGYGGEELVLAASDAAYAGATDAAVLMQGQLAKAGINMRVERVPADGYWSNIWLKRPWCAAYWGGRPTCDWMFAQGYASGANWNDTHFSHERFDQLLAMGRAETDSALRAEIYGEMQGILRDLGGALVWGFANFVDAMSDRIAHGPEVSSNYALDGGRFIERWWFA